MVGLSLVYTKAVRYHGMTVGFFVFVFFNIYLFIWLHQVLVAAGGLLCCGSRAP